MSDRPPTSPLRQAEVLRLWLPLAASWLLMGVEMPLFSAVVARMDTPQVHLAAYSSVVLPLSLLIEAPIIMLLAAATALVSDAASYRKLHRFMTAASVVLTAIHIAVAFTPLFDVVAAQWMDVPDEVLEPARLGLKIMTPWTWAIAHRRMNQGVLIRYGRSRSVGLGTLVRLAVNLSVLIGGYLVGGLPGVAVGTLALATAVVVEAVWIAWTVRTTLRELAQPAPTDARSLNLRTFLVFYVPLAATPLVTLAVQPLGAAAMSRMPNPLYSLAAWAPVYGLVFLLRALGMAYNEVVVSRLGFPGAERGLRRFGVALALCLSGVLLVVSLTPLSRLWFEVACGLDADLVEISCRALPFAALMPAYAAMQSWYQGTLVHRRETRAIIEAVVVYLIVTSIALAGAVQWSTLDGIRSAILCFTAGGVMQTLWLRMRVQSATPRAVH